MEREGIFDAVRPRRARLDLHYAKSNAPAVDEPISPTVEVEKTSHRFAEHDKLYQSSICIESPFLIRPSRALLSNFEGNSAGGGA